MNGECKKRERGARCSTNSDCDIRSVCVGSFCMRDFPCWADFQCYGSKCVNQLCRNESS